MESSDDKHWAQRALIDPLNEPEPFAETGPGTSFRPDSKPIPTRNRSSSASAKLQKGNPFRKSSSTSKNPFIAESEVSRHDSTRSYPSPPQSASPRKDRFSPRHEAFGRYTDTPPAPPAKDGSTVNTKGVRRGNSLNERYPGDRSHRPLDTIKHERKAADRAPHLRKHHQIRLDPVDKLDPTARYHHEGPFDATYYTRNTSYVNAPIEALAASNEEAIKATPREKILDSVHRHRPLDGVATYAPGEVDPNGQVYNYEQGENMMIHGNPEGGAYKRWPGMKYQPDDIKGKGEPSYTLEKSLKDYSPRHDHSTEQGGIELTSRPRAISGAHQRKPMFQDFGEDEGQIPTGGSVRRSNTTGEKKLNKDSHGGGGSIKHRFGSIRKSIGGHKDE